VVVVVVVRGPSEFAPLLCPFIHTIESNPSMQMQMLLLFFVLLIRYKKAGGPRRKEGVSCWAWRKKQAEKDTFAANEGS